TTIAPSSRFGDLIQKGGDLIVAAMEEGLRDSEQGSDGSGLCGAVLRGSEARDVRFKAGKAELLDPRPQGYAELIDTVGIESEADQVADSVPETLELPSPPVHDAIVSALTRSRSFVASRTRRSSRSAKDSAAKVSLLA